MVPLLALVASGCDSGSTPKAPTGQVVATVDGEEITVRQLQAELSRAVAVPPAQQKEQRRAALNFIVERTVLADEARKEGIDKDPEFVLLNQRATDTLLVQQLQAKIAAGVPAPTAEEATRFQNDNPNMFAERKIFDVEQIRMTLPSDRSILAKLQPLKTLDEVADLLTQNKIAFQRGTASIDAIAQTPKLVNAIVALPPQEVFVFPTGNQVLINQIRNTRVQPFTGEVADKYALNVLKLERTQAAVQRQMAAIIAKAKSRIQVAKEYQAPAKTPAKAPAAPAQAPAKAQAKTGG